MFFFRFENVSNLFLEDKALFFLQICIYDVTIVRQVKTIGKSEESETKDYTCINGKVDIYILTDQL